MIFFLKNWKLFAALGLATALFLGGWYTNGWRWEAKFADAAIAATQEYEAIQQKLNAEFAAQLEVDENARRKLAAALKSTRTHASALEKEARSLRLTQSRIPDETSPTGECNVETIHNPFSDNFVRLWNASANSPISRSTATE